MYNSDFNTLSLPTNLTSGSGGGGGGGGAYTNAQANYSGGTAGSPRAGYGGSVSYSTVFIPPSTYNYYYFGGYGASATAGTSNGDASGGAGGWGYNALGGSYGTGSTASGAPAIVYIYTRKV